MMINAVPTVFLQLLSDECIGDSDLFHTQDGFWISRRSLADVLAKKDIFYLLDADRARLACDKFFDDWFLYAVPSEGGFVYGLLKLREQEHDAKCGALADGDTPGVTVSFVAFSCEVLLGCLASPTDENRRRLDGEIDRVVARGGQRHHKALKGYFVDPSSEGAYLIADLYVRYIASFAEKGELAVPERYLAIAAKRKSALPTFIESVNVAAGRVVCDHERLYIQNPEEPTEQERAAILATHTGNTSVYSFAAEIEYHARFLTPLAKIWIPFLGRSLYGSAIRADMSVDDAARGRFVPYYRENSKILRRQRRLHKNSDRGEQ